MIPAELRIQFDNFMEEARWAFHGGDFMRAAELLDRARDLALRSPAGRELEAAG